MLSGLGKRSLFSSARLSSTDCRFGETRCVKKMKRDHARKMDCV